MPALFSGISWGTAEVLQQTVYIAKQLDLSVAYLSELADVDRPRICQFGRDTYTGVRDQGSGTFNNSQQNR